jgi:hypothetical protein
MGIKKQAAAGGLVRGFCARAKKAAAILSSGPGFQPHRRHVRASGTVQRRNT